METDAPTSRPTFLDAVLQVVDDGGQDSGQTHDLGTLGQAEGEELIPTGPYQAGIAVLPGDTGEGRCGCELALLQTPASPKQVDSASMY